MGNQHTLIIASLNNYFVRKLRVVDFRANAATGTANNPSWINDFYVTAITEFDAEAEYCEVEFTEPFLITQFRHYGATMSNADGAYKIQHWDGAAWVDNTTAISTRIATWSAFADLTIPVVTTKIRIVATTLDTYGDHNVCSEWEIIG